MLLLLWAFSFFSDVGYVRIASSFYYITPTEEYSFLDARSFCQSLGNNNRVGLANLETAAESQAVVQFLANTAGLFGHPDPEKSKWGPFRGFLPLRLFGFVQRYYGSLAITFGLQKFLPGVTFTDETRKSSLIDLSTGILSSPWLTYWFSNPGYILQPATAIGLD